MITKKTVLVLGAGASWPYHFPLGGELVARILSFNPSYVIHNPGFREHGLSRTLHPIFDDDRLFVAFRKCLREANCSSIDVFLSNHPEYDRVGRASIATVLIPCENWGHLVGTDRPNWYNYLKNKMGDSVDNFQASLNNLVIVTFNYDRSLEYFFYTSLCATFDPAKGLELMQSMNIVHVHGQLGKPHFLTDTNNRQYSQDLNRDAVEIAASQIKVIYDQLDDSEEFKQAHQALSKAERVCFLGFGYNETNLRRLELRKCFKGRILLGTAFDLETDEVRRVRNLVDGPIPVKKGDLATIELGDIKEDCWMFLRKHHVIDT